MAAKLAASALKLLLAVTTSAAVRQALTLMLAICVRIASALASAVPFASSQRYVYVLKPSSAYGRTDHENK